MPDQPLVSVGLPTYNRARDLERAINSVLTQDYSNFELIISDNASTDGTRSLCEEFGRKDQRIKYIRQPANRGPAPNFRTVLDEARGEFFMWLGDDDWLDPGYISQCVQTLAANPDHSLACGAAKYFQNGKLLLNGEHISLLQSSGTERVVTYFQQVYANGAFYGVMRSHQLRLELLPNVLGGDWVLIAAMAFMGKIETITGTAVNRSWEGVSRNTKAITATLGISSIYARTPQLSIALAAFKDIAWQSPVYASLSRAARLALASRVFAVFHRKFFLPHWRQTARSWRAKLYPIWARPILFAISVKHKIFRKHVR